MSERPNFTYHNHRIDKPVEIFNGDLIDRNGERVLIYSAIPSPHREHLSEAFSRRGWIRPGEAVAAVRKRLFFHQYFTIVEFLYPGDALIGTYCDIALPLEQRGDGYHIQDLMLDLWIYADGRYEIWDRDELQDALAAKLISPELAALAEEKLAVLIVEVEAGRFPRDYLV